ncbi:helix-turn-helix transcriptional regulator [Novosphingobium colocasiae]|uniref:PadR family transcriptional regulator n=1 Tax=Novosphingobium colocasiae TaxID=1256513 RepID=UPI0035B26CEF
MNPCPSNPGRGGRGPFGGHDRHRDERGQFGYHHVHPHRHGRHAMGLGPRGFDPEGGAPFAGGFPGGFGGGRGGGRRRRIFDQGELQVLLLALIVESPRHGYDLIRAIEALSGGAYAPSPGVVYPALTYMEEAGTIAPVADDSARKAFEATAQGRAQAEADAEKAETLRTRLAALAQERERLDPAPVRRAMHNLKLALHERLSAAETTRATLLEIADLIDDAARRIERIEP